MDRIIVTGGSRLAGEVCVSGAKNAALPALAATLLAKGTHELTNVPSLADVSTFIRLLEQMGMSTERPSETATSRGALALTLAGPIETVAPYQLVKTMRASVLVLGPLVARHGHASVSLPGGCAIGARPIDQHLKGLVALGAQVRLEHGDVVATAERLIGAPFRFDVVSVTGTENLMMAATLAKGRTVLQNAAREPEVVDLALMLQSMGAKISGAGTETITIDGVEALSSARHAIVEDRVEAGTLLVAAAITGGDVLVKGARREHLAAVLEKLRGAGAEILYEEDALRCRGPERLRPVEFETEPFPGFPTDMQAQLMALLTLADGTSRITESVFENRFMHVLELGRMGAEIRVDGRVATVTGVRELSGAPVMATDLRASASLVLAGLRARGQTEVQRVYHLDRGYDHLETKLASLGARIERLSGRV